MAALFGTPVNRALINVFFLTDRNKKDTGIERKDVKPKPIKSVGVVGAGIMGQGITAATLKRKLPVFLADAVAPALAKGVEQVLEEVAYDRETQKARRAKGRAVRGPAESGHGRRRAGSVRPGDRSDRRESGGQEAALCAARAATGRPRDPGLEHLDDSDHEAGRGTEATRAVLRHPLFQSGPQDAAGRGDSRRQDERRNRGHGRGLCQEHRQVADRGQRRARLPGQSAAAAVHERGAGADLRRRRDQSHRTDGQGFRHADGPDHAVRRRRTGYGVLCRHA